MDINREMEMMLAENDIDLKPKKGKKKKQNGQAQDGASFSNAKNMLTVDTLLQNQIQAAQLADVLIDELKSAEESKDGQLVDLKQTCESMKVHSETMDEQKRYLNDRISELSKENDCLKQKFSALLDQF